MISDIEEQAKNAAREVFFLRHPEHLAWFDQGWDAIAQGPREDWVSPDPPIWLLAASGRPTPASRQMAADLALLFATFAQKYPLVRDEILRKLDETGRSQGRGDLQIESLRRDVAAAVAPGEAYYCWQSSGSEFPRASQIETVEARQRLLSQAKGFDVFVCRGTVLNGDRRTTRNTGVTGRIYRLLVLFLRYKLQHLPVGQLYFRAWDQRGTADEKDIMERFLKPAVSELRTKLKMVPGFTVDKDPNGYVCSGDFSSCVILGEREEKSLAIGS